MNAWKTIHKVTARSFLQGFHSSTKDVAFHTLTKRLIIAVLACVQLCYEHTVLYFLISDIGNGKKGGFTITLRTLSLNGPFVLSCWSTTWGSLDFKPHFPLGRLSYILYSPTRQPLFYSSRQAGFKLQQKKKLMTHKNKISMISNTETSNITLSFSPSVVSCTIS